MDISASGLQLIEQFEGYSFKAYWDPYGHVWTVGYGETEHVTASTTMTRAQAEADLKTRVVREYEPAIKAVGVPLNQNQFDALCSFVWNLGPGAVGTGYTMGQRLRARDYAGAAAAFMLYTRAGGVVLQGLVNRRAEERKLFLTPVSDAYAIFDTSPHTFSRRWLANEPSLGRAHPKLLMSFSGASLTLVEKNVVRRFDQSHTHRDALWMLVLRLRLAWVASSEPDGWNKHNRRARWNAMWERTRTV